MLKNEWMEKFINFFITPLCCVVCRCGEWSSRTRMCWRWPVGPRCSSSTTSMAPTTQSTPPPPTYPRPDCSLACTTSCSHQVRRLFSPHIYILLLVYTGGGFKTFLSNYTRIKRVLNVNTCFFKKSLFLLLISKKMLSLNSHLYN